MFSRKDFIDKNARLRDNTESLRRNYTALEIILNKDSLLEPLFRERKGVGDIDAVRRKWSELHTIMEAKEKPKISESKLKEMWDEVSLVAGWNTEDKTDKFLSAV